MAPRHGLLQRLYRGRGAKPEGRSMSLRRWLGCFYWLCWLRLRRLFFLLGFTVIATKKSSKHTLPYIGSRKDLFPRPLFTRPESFCFE